MANVIFLFIFIIGLVYGLFSGRADILLDTLLTAPKNAFLIFIDIYTSLIFWGGILEMCKRSGMLRIIGNATSCLLRPLFKGLDKDSLALQYISLNLVSNALSMGSAATPFGLKAMDELKKLSNNDEASNEMITFLLINVGGFCVLPTTIMTILSQYGSKNSSIIIPFIVVISIVCTTFSTVLNNIIIKYEKH